MSAMKTLIGTWIYSLKGFYLAPPIEGWFYEQCFCYKVASVTVRNIKIY